MIYSVFRKNVFFFQIQCKVLIAMRVFSAYTPIGWQFPERPIAASAAAGEQWFAKNENS